MIAPETRIELDLVIDGILIARSFPIEVRQLLVAVPAAIRLEEIEPVRQDSAGAAIHVRFGQAPDRRRRDESGPLTSRARRSRTAPSKFGG